MDSKIKLKVFKEILNEFRTKNMAWRLFVDNYFLNPLNPSVALIFKPVNQCCSNQLTGFCMRATLTFNGLKKFIKKVFHIKYNK